MMIKEMLKEACCLRWFETDDLRAGTEAQLMEYLDIVDENGEPTGEIVSRYEAHRIGILHRTAHVWVVRVYEGQVQILLQKRSMEKESFPGMFDTSSAGHIPAGTEPLVSARRELKEELGIDASEEQLSYVGVFRIRYEKEFHGKLFRDNEVTQVYVYQEPVEIGSLVLQSDEVDEVRWFNLEYVWEQIQHSRKRFCVPTQGLQILKSFLEGENNNEHAGNRKNEKKCQDL